MNVPGQNHRDPWFADFFKACLVDSKYIFKTTEATPFLFPGTGTGGWEAALTNTLSPGECEGWTQQAWQSQLQALDHLFRLLAVIACPIRMHGANHPATRCLMIQDQQEVSSM